MNTSGVRNSISQHILEGRYVDSEVRERFWGVHEITEGSVCYWTYQSDLEGPIEMDYWQLLKETVYKYVRRFLGNQKG